MLAVMDRGRFVQTGTPSQVYEYPNSRYVADFFGTINIFHGSLGSSDEQAIHIACDETGTTIHANRDGHRQLPAEFHVAVRPEKIRLSREAPAPDGDTTIIRGVVEDLAYYGNYSIYRVRSDTGKQVQVLSQNTQRSSELVLEWEDQVYMSWPRDCSVVLTQ